MRISENQDRRMGVYRRGIFRWSAAPRACLALIAALAVLLLAIPARADTIFMQDGRVFTGTIVEEDEGELTIEIDQRGIRSKLTLRKAFVRKIIRIEDDGELTADGPDAFLDLRSGPQREDEPDAPRVPGKPTLLEIPIAGVFGEDVYPGGVERAIDSAAQRGVTDVVFRIDSPGGEVWVALELARIIADYRENNAAGSAKALKFHALIERAISAAIWPAFNCDTIAFAPGSTMGAAVVFRQDAVGNIEVRTKLNSALAAELAAAAEARGHDPDLIRAMILMDAELFAVPEGDGFTLVASRPTGDVPGIEEIDDSFSVLTLTGGEAARFGVGTGLDDATLAALAGSIGLAEGDWEDAGDFGKGVVDSISGRCADLRRDLVSAYADLTEHTDRAISTRNLDEAIDALEDWKKAYGRIARLRRQAQSLAMGELVSELDRGGVRKTLTEVNDLLRELRAQRRGP